MKKNTRIISLTAAALLAVSPVVASATTVKAAEFTYTSNSTSTGTSTSTSTTPVQAPQNKPYFTYKNNVIGEATTDNPTGNVVPTTISIKKGEDVDTFVSQINNLVQFHESNSNVGTNPNFSKENLSTYKISITQDSKTKKDVIDDFPSSPFNIVLTGKGSDGLTATIQIPIVPSTSSTTDTTDSPVFNWTWGDKKHSNGLDGQVFQVAENTNFNPTNFVDSNGDQITISAQQTKNNTTNAAIAASGSVDTSQPGRYYNVTLTATGMTGKKATATYTVLITSSKKQTLYANGASSIATYNIYGNNVLSGSTTFKDGDQVYVADQTKTIDGVSYSRVSTKSKADASSSNVWVKTSSLVKPAGDTNVETHTVMVDSRAYSKTGQYLGKVYHAYNNIDIVPTVVTINGKTYYKVANKDEYVRVTNITGNKRTLKRNAYIYWSSTRRTPGTKKMYKGDTVTTYGSQIKFKNGKKYYRIEGCRDNNKRYIKAVNFY